MNKLWRWTKALPAAIATPFLVSLAIIGVALADLWWLIFGRQCIEQDSTPNNHAASVVIPNWNGRDLLEKYLPAVVTALAGNPKDATSLYNRGVAKQKAGDAVGGDVDVIAARAIDPNVGK